jgi:PAS domain S-box-containing protein
MSTLRDERRRLETILASMSDAVIMVDSSGELTLTNAAFKVVFGEALPALEDASGHRLPSRAHPLRMAARGETFTQPFTIQSDGGARRWFEASGQPIRVDGFAGGVVVIREVTDRSLRQLHEQFVALAGHELRMPLSALSASLQLLQRSLNGGRAPELTERYVRLALAQARLMGELVQDLADVIRVQAGQMPIARQPVDLVQLVSDAVELARPLSDSQTIRLDASSEHILVSADPRRMQQVVLNLISNALQHGASDQGMDIRVGRDTDMAVLEVVDYGPGIAGEDREHIFERFFQAGADSGRGLGVGLYLVHAIVTGHGGTIDALPSEPHGTTFKVRLPLDE